MAEQEPATSMLDLIDTTTILSLLSTVAILGAAYLVSLRALSPSTSIKIRVLFIWHAFDALIHFILEGSFLYNCFFSYTLVRSAGTASGLRSSTAAGNDASYLDATKELYPAGLDAAVADLMAANAATHATTLGLGSTASEYLPPNVYFLGRKARIYGSAYGTNPFAALWMEYAKADRRWSGTDLTVISLELLTVFLMAPLAVAVCVWLARASWEKHGGGGAAAGGKRRRGAGKEWFWMVVIATGELYGGFMTFAPEWLSGSPNLDTSNFMYKWVYLFFFNTLWVFIPLWVLNEAYVKITDALTVSQDIQTAKRIE